MERKIVRPGIGKGLEGKRENGEKSEVLHVLFQHVFVFQNSILITSQLHFY